jgi:hypothetical protein
LTTIASLPSFEVLLGFFLSVEDHELLREVLILEAEFLTDLNETSEAVNVIWSFSVDVLIDLESLVEEVHSSET